MSKQNKENFDELNVNHSLNAILNEIKIVGSTTSELKSPVMQLLSLTFKKGTDDVSLHITDDSLFEAIAEYYEHRLVRDAKTGVTYKGYYASGVL